MFNRAREWRLFEGENPTSGIRAYREQQRDRFLSAEEMERVVAVLRAEPAPWGPFFLLSLLLGTRRGELLSARWEDMRLDDRIWRIPQTKADRPHRLPLPAAAVEIIRELPSRGRSPYLFPGPGKTGHLVSPKRAWRRISRAAGVDDVRIHDLRRTLGSWLAAHGHSLVLIGRALNHTSSDATAIYARLDTEPIRVALEENATAMLKMDASIQPAASS